MERKSLSELVAVLCETRDIQATSHRSRACGGMYHMHHADHTHLYTVMCEYRSFYVSYFVLFQVSSTLGTIIKLYKRADDNRRCILCHQRGDGKSNGAARLLNMDGDKYVHLNCALWSYEVYETLNGALMNVDAACKHAGTIECVSCKKKGATVGCFKQRCTNLYHVSCAQKAGAVFYQNKVS